MRIAFRQFMTAAGPDAIYFSEYNGPASADPYTIALERLRTLVGMHVAVIASEYGITLEPDLAQILPPEFFDDDNDPSIIPAWEDARDPDGKPI